MVGKEFVLDVLPHALVVDRVGDKPVISPSILLRRHILRHLRQIPRSPLPASYAPSTASSSALPQPHR